MPHHPDKSLVNFRASYHNAPADKVLGVILALGLADKVRIVSVNGGLLFTIRTGSHDLHWRVSSALQQESAHHRHNGTAQIFVRCAK